MAARCPLLVIPRDICNFHTLGPFAAPEDEKLQRGAQVVVRRFSESFEALSVLARLEQL